MKKQRARSGITPIRVLPLGFLIIIVIGSVLLMLPAASVSGEPLPFLSALFTATSATCVTGLIVVDTGTYFTTFGQAVILVLIQLGGLGFMAVSTMLFVLLGRRISLKQRMTIAESFGESRLQGIVKLGLKAAAVTFSFECIGALLLAVRFVPEFGPRRGAWYALFTSVSAFCNAGFDLMGGYRSFTGYTGDPLVNFVLIALITGGGLGFTAVLDVWNKRRFTKLRLHTKLVLTASGVLLIGGAAFILLFEYANPATLGALPLGGKALASLFQSVTLRTAGFNTIDQLALTDATKLFSSVLMLIGGSPAGTAGGFKTTTIAIMLLTVVSESRGRRDVMAFGRRLPTGSIRRALCIISIGLAAFITAVTALSLIERGTPAGDLGFLNLFFEAASALGTVGISAGFTGLCGSGARIILILMMFIGRVGLITLSLSLAGGGASGAPLRLPEEDILIG